MREDSVKDIGTLLDWIAGDPRLDAKRVMVTGGSYGGYMTLASAFHFNNRLCGTVDFVGISNFLSFFEGTSASGRVWLSVRCGDQPAPKPAAFLRPAPPANTDTYSTTP